MGKLDNHVALVTGASRGIGKAVAMALATEGAHVVLVARSAFQLDSTSKEIEGKGLSASAEVADITIPVQVEKAINETASRFGRLDILVNNAGMGHFKPAIDMTLDEFDEMWNLNMRGVFVATKVALPHMIKAGRGTIVNISSLAGKNSFKGGTGYCATKWALRGFASSLMLEVREHNIRVITIFPGSVDTSFSSMNKKGKNITQPEDVADAVVFAVTAPERSMFSEIDVRPTNP
ncbi:MAG: 3-oxoacyl-(acyl-carrier protein) reductase [Bacteroidetes bacterium]|nr:3-oxoacyl-(acyl-carrier protein) reductase [Bacteroidota bacterium]MBM2840843.1 3-oxoacyl-(acyl-carrier protein) reductase [Bacteroidota bacterium]